jgi:catechol 2,3-dioxygenase-like lactoylglutathione lyase family enzyme
MKVRKLGWLGIRTAEYEQTVAFFRDVLGLRVRCAEPDFAMFQLPDGAKVEVFGPESQHNRHFDGPVVGFLVDDVGAGAVQLAAAGTEVYPVLREGRDAWVHFRAPDGHLYELTEAPDVAG